MELIIDISEEIIEYIKNNGCLSVVYTDEVARAIRNGTPLPKGHGRLIDADELDITSITTDDYSGNEVLDVVLKEDVDMAETIIEADM